MMTPTASKLDNQITEIIEPKKAKEQKLIVNTFNTGSINPIPKVSKTVPIIININRI